MLLNFKIVFLNIFFLINFLGVYGQTTYTFTNAYDASWSNAPNWSPSYPGETIESGDTVIISNGASCHTTGLDIINNGTIIINPLGFLALDAGAVFQFINNGVIENSGDIVVYFGNNTLINNGELINNSIVTGVGNHSIVNSTDAIITNNDRFFVNDQLTNDGEINNNDGATFSIAGTLQNNNDIRNEGIIKGNGVLNPNSNYSSSLLSRIEPGFNSGTLTSHGNLDLEITTVGIEIDGTNQTNDVFAVVGNANIEDAKLDIIWTELPTANASYTVMTFTSRTGVFSTVNIPPVNGFNFNVSYTSTEVKIEVTQNGLGVNDLSIKDNIVIWPNPTNDLLNIDLSEYKDEVVIKILDVLGKEIYTKKYINQKTISANLNINKGIYFLNVIDDKKNKKIFKIIKN